MTSTIKILGKPRLEENTLNMIMIVCIQLIASVIIKGDLKTFPEKKAM